MVNTKISVAIFALLMININAQNTCASSTVMNAFGFTPLSSVQVITNGTCQNYFKTGGACVSPFQVMNAMNVTNAWLHSKAIDASNFALQFPNASVYFAQVQGWITANTVVTSQDKSFLDSVSDFFKSVWDYTKSIFQTFYTWVVNLFANATTAINPCFQAWANITNGAYCLAASNKDKAALIVQSVNNVYTVPGDYQSAGQALNACLPLIDIYCSLNYGFSISNTSLPFNQTFAWGDGAISLSTCQVIKDSTPAFCPSGTATTCTTVLYTALAGLFQSNWLPFVPTAASILNLGNFLTGNSKAWNTFTNTPFTPPTSAGFKIARDLTNPPENLYGDGLISGQPPQFYKFAFNLVAFAILSLISFLI